MSIQEQIEKVNSDLEKLDEKKKRLLEKKKELQAKLELEKARNEARKNETVMKIISENFGEITEENLGRFEEIMKRYQNQFPGQM